MDTTPRRETAEQPENQPLELARFQALLTLIVTEGQLIWSRYYSLLTANAIVAVVLGAVASRDLDTAATIVLLSLGLFGFLLTWQWRQLTRHGWQLQHTWVAAAKQVQWQGRPNPFEPYSEWCKTAGCGEGTSDWIAKWGQRVINLFLVAYGSAMLFAAARLARWLV